MDNSVKNLAEWSKAVRERDGRCLDCGAAFGLVAHHVQPKSTHPELKLDLSNGKTLCAICHLQHHKNHPVSNAGPRLSRGRIARLKAEIKMLRAENAKLSPLAIEVASLRIQCAEYENAYNSMMAL